MPKLVYGVCLDVQKAEITHFCFGVCGRIGIGAIMAEEVVFCPCSVEDCPHEELHSTHKFPLEGAFFGQAMSIRKLKKIDLNHSEAEGVKDGNKSRCGNGARDGVDTPS